MNSIGPIPPDRPELLAELEYDVLRRLVFDVLHGATVIGPPLDPRRGIRPFEQLSKLFRRADHTVRGRITEVVREFLGDLTNTAVWPAEARWDLLDFIQDCGQGVIDDIRALVREKTLYDAVDIGPEGHAALVKCLLSLGVLSAPVSWMEQFQLLGEDFGAFIFSGLVEHGLDEAVSRLPMLCASDHAAQELRLLIPGLVDQFGLERVQESFEPQLSQLPEKAAKMIAEDLGITVPPEEAQRTSVSWADLIADEVLLAGDTIAINDMDKFRTAVGSVVQGLVVAQEIPAPSAESRDRLALAQTAKLAVHLASLVSGSKAPEFLWRVCEKLLLVFASRRLTPHAEPDYGWAQIAAAAHQGVADDVENCLWRFSKPVARVVPRGASKRRGPRPTHG